MNNKETFQTHCRYCYKVFTRDSYQQAKLAVEDHEITECPKRPKLQAVCKLVNKKID